MSESNTSDINQTSKASTGGTDVGGETQQAGQCESRSDANAKLALNVLVKESQVQVVCAECFLNVNCLQFPGNVPLSQHSNIAAPHPGGGVVLTCSQNVFPVPAPPGSCPPGAQMMEHPLCSGANRSKSRGRTRPIHY